MGQEKNSLSVQNLVDSFGFLAIGYAICERAYPTLETSLKIPWLIPQSFLVGLVEGIEESGNTVALDRSEIENAQLETLGSILNKDTIIKDFENAYDIQDKKLKKATSCLQDPNFDFGQAFLTLPTCEQSALDRVFRYRFHKEGNTKVDIFLSRFDDLLKAASASLSTPLMFFEKTGRHFGKSAAQFLCTPLQTGAANVVSFSLMTMCLIESQAGVAKIFYSIPKNAIMVSASGIINAYYADKDTVERELRDFTSQIQEADVKSFISTIKHNYEIATEASLKKFREYDESLKKGGVAQALAKKTKLNIQALLNRKALLRVQTSPECQFLNKTLHNAISISFEYTLSPLLQTTGLQISTDILTDTTRIKAFAQAAISVGAKALYNTTFIATLAVRSIGFYEVKRKVNTPSTRTIREMQRLESRHRKQEDFKQERRYSFRLQERKRRSFTPQHK